jgi:hypothetical protein
MQLNDHREGGLRVGGSDIQMISVVKQIFFIDKSKQGVKII